jgi:hypothetical protein
MFDNPAAWALAALVVPCAFLAIKYWQGALFAVFVLLVFEGALRKWAFPSAQAQMYLVKDGILLAAYLGFILDSRRKRPEPKGIGLIKIILVISFVWGCIEVFNPNSPSIVVGFMGLKSYFLYVPVAFILPYAIKSREHLFVLIRRYIIIAIPVAVLGFIQIAAGPASSLNVYVGTSEDTPAMAAHFGQKEFVRTSGTFSYVSGYAVFLTFIAFLGIGYNMAHGWRLKNNITPIVALTLVAGAMFTTGSRGPIWMLLASGPVILWLAARSRVLSPQIAVRVFILVPVIAILALNISPEAVEAFKERLAETQDTSAYTLERLYQAPWETMGVLSYAPILGVGIGTTHSAALVIMGTDPWWLGGLMTEAEMARVTHEQGPIGLLLTYSLRFLIPAFALRWAMRFKDPAYRVLGIALAVYLTQGIWSSIILNATANLFYWGAFGVVLAMWRLEQPAGAELATRLVRRAGATNLRPAPPNPGAVRRRPS